MLAQIFKHYAACTDFSPLFVDNNREKSVQAA
jgi:hypothetical protein